MRELNAEVMIPQWEMCLSEGGINVTADTKVYVRESPNCSCGCAKMRRGREVFSLPRCILCRLSKDSGPAAVSEIQPAGEGRNEGIPRRDTKQCLYLHMWQSFKIFSNKELIPPVPGTIRGILSVFPSLLPSATTFSSSDQYHGDLFQKEEV